MQKCGLIEAATRIKPQYPPATLHAMLTATFSVYALD
jgi:hypothetical protein